MIGHEHEARQTNFIFQIGEDRDLALSVQQTNLTDVTLGQTMYPTGPKDLVLPSNKLEQTPLQMDILLSEDLREWLQIYKWLLLCKNMETRILDHIKTCSLILLDSQSQPVLTFVYEDSFPTQLGGLQYTMVGDDNPVLTTQCEFAFNRLTVVDKNGNELHEDFTG